MLIIAQLSWHHVTKVGEKIIEKLLEWLKFGRVSMAAYWEGAQLMPYLHYESSCSSSEKRKLHIVFVDLEKAYNLVPRELVGGVFNGEGSEKNVSFIQDMHDAVTTVDKTNGFSVKNFQ